jgi:hypothetical protein
MAACWADTRRRFFSDVARGARWDLQGEKKRWSFLLVNRDTCKKRIEKTERYSFLPSKINKILEVIPVQNKSTFKMVKVKLF